MEVFQAFKYSFYLFLEMEEKFILVSLNENKSKDIAIAMSNKTARKILDYLSEKEKVSPTELSQKMHIPLTTVTHALELLEKEGFIVRADHAWSEKGRKVSLYSLAKKMILIVPKGYDWKEGLKKILPIFVIGIGITAALKIYSSFTERTVNIQEASLSSMDTVVAEQSTREAFHLPQEAWLYTLAITFSIIFIVFIYEVWRKHR